MPTTRLTEADDDLRRSATQLVSDSGLPTVGLDQAWTILVSTDGNGSVEGVVALERHRQSGSAAYLLRSLAVRADRRGAGLGRQLVDAATAAADADQGSPATIGLLTETAVGYFEQFGFHRVTRDRLPAALSMSPELSGACAQTAQAYLRSA